MSPDKGKSQAERGANLFISKHKPDSSCDVYTGKELWGAGGGGTRVAQEELWLFIFRKASPPRIEYIAPFPGLFFLTL